MIPGVAAPQEQAADAHPCPAQPGTRPEPKAIPRSYHCSSALHTSHRSLQLAGRSVISEQKINIYFFFQHSH